MEGTEAVHPYGTEGPRSRADPDRTCHTGGDTGREQLTASECESDYYLFGLFKDLFLRLNALITCEYVFLTFNSWCLDEMQLLKRCYHKVMSLSVLSDMID